MMAVIPNRSSLLGIYLKSGASLSNTNYMTPSSKGPIENLSKTISYLESLAFPTYVKIYKYIQIKFNNYINILKINSIYLPIQ